MIVRTDYQSSVAPAASATSATSASTAALAAQPPVATRGGFTLIEMLVSSAIVSIIMLLFAQVFTLASSSITDQRALARNAQQARAFSQVLRSDLGFRTFRQRTDAQPLDVNSVMGSYSASEQPSPAAATAIRQLLTGTYDLSPTGIVPLAPGDEVDKRQSGYFYVSENDPNDDTDDVMQITIFIDDLGKVEPSLQAYYGGQTRALPYPGYGGPPTLDGNNSSFADGARNNGRVDNQPDNDDGFGPVGQLNQGGGYDPATPGGTANQRLRSRAAEVVYFLRGGNLYRRSMPLRDEPNATRQALAAGQPRMGNTGLGDRFLSDAGFVSPVSADGTNSFGIPGSYVSPGGNTFWNEQDLSAARVPYDVQYNGNRSSGNGGAAAAAFSSGLWINSTLSLDNSLGPANRPLALPWMRFGHYGYTASGILGGDRLIGRPREYGVTQLNGDAVPTFFGRFTHAETSDSKFIYPGTEAGPMDPIDPMLDRGSVAVPDSDTGQLGSQNYELRVGAVGNESLFNGERAGTDLLLSGVTAFDIEFWDSLQQQFVDIGRPAVPSSPSQWSSAQQTQSVAPGLPGYNVEFYGPGYLPSESTSNPAFNNVFDTWHTDCDISFINPADGSILPHGDGVADLPPYRSLQVDHRPLLQVGTGAFNGVGNYSIAAGTAAFWQTNQGAVQTDYNPSPFGVRQAANLDGVNLANSIIGSVVFANPLIEPYVETTFEVPAANYTTGDGMSTQSARPRVPRVGAGYRTISPGVATSMLSQLAYMQPGPAILFNGAIAFRCVGFNDLDSDGFPDVGLDQPRWPTTPGDRVQDGELVWEAFDNRAGLKKMRITIRYNDAESGNPRQVSLVHSFVE